MKWLLVILIFEGGVNYIPMDSQQSCLKAQTQVNDTWRLTRASAICIQQNGE